VCSFFSACPRYLVEIFEKDPVFLISIMGTVSKQNNSELRQKLTYEATEVIAMTTAHTTSQKQEKIYYFLKYDKAKN
jgi:hypothetical protein